MKATDKQLQYIYSLATAAGARDGREWLLDHVGASMSMRPSNVVSKAKASEIIDMLLTQAAEAGEDA